MEINTVFFGPVSTGKTDALINKYQEVGKPSVYLKISQDKAVTLKEESYKQIKGFLTNGSLEYLQGFIDSNHYFFFDDAHFIKNWSKFYRILKGKTVYASCLDLDYNGNPWKGVGNLICKSIYPVKLHGKCPEGKRTDYSFLKNDKYIPVCKECFQNKKCLCIDWM